MVTTVLCPSCNAERGAVVTVASRGSSATRSAPAEPMTFDVVGLYEDCACGETLDTDANERAAIESALDAARESALDAKYDDRGGR